VPSLKSSLQVLALLAFGGPLLAQTAGNPTPKPALIAPGKVPVQSSAITTKQGAAKPTGTKAAVLSAKNKKGKKQPEPPPQAHVPATPPPPPTPAQLPPTAARVSMRGGLLTIEANNSTLADVLAGVRRETKAAIDFPPGASGERVVASLGPGTPQNVLAALFNGSRFDYIILGSQDQPQAVQRVILRAKSGPEPAPTAVAANGNPQNASPQNNGNRVVQPAEEQNEDNDQGAPAEEAPDESNNQQQQQPQQEIDGEQQQGQQQNQNQQQPGVKTPEQLLEELRQMQQQQQQNQNPQQQQQQPPPQQPTPDEQ